ncbi:MAG: hypothetical protein GF313_01405 [Caldithrix sp.]|nr:hypothetical protein [Caldithrix sp.]
MKPLLIITFITLVSASLWGQTTKHHASMPIKCSKCHTCNNPTYLDPCLKVCPDFKRAGVSVRHTADEAPEIIKIDTLANVYQASIFTHKLHAEMSAMSGGCSLCHHHNPPGPILQCSDCHQAKILRDDLTKPGLKGAYHQQCLNCHKSWSHANNCEVCHARQTDAEQTASTADKEAFKGKEHPEVTEPEKKVYQTGFESLPVVTFYHDDHAHRFGYECVDCHKNESCRRCHDTLAKPSEFKEDVHEPCMACHAEAVENKCTVCHAKTEQGRFEHANVGWPLESYHQTLHCQSCHGVDKTFNKLNSNCKSCHKDWTPDNFNHTVTGLRLDEVHASFDCKLCHENRAFSENASCSNCHEGYTYPAQKPGN